MKKLFLSTIFLFVAQFLFGQILPIRNALLNRDEKNVLVVAHRGDWRQAPENSLKAIELAIGAGANIVEIDLAKTKDGHIVLMHDKTLERTTTGKGNISDWTLDSLRTLKLKNGAGIRTKHMIPTLEEALLFAKGKVMLNLDKAYYMFDEVYALLEKTQTTDHIIMKGSKDVATVKKQFGKYLDKVIYMPIVNLDKPNALQMIEDFQQDLNPVAYELIFKEDSNPLPVQLAKALKGKSLIWYNTLWDTMAGGHDDDMAVDDVQAAYGYLIKTLNTRIIQTDRPAYLVEYLKSLKMNL